MSVKVKVGNIYPTLNKRTGVGQQGKPYLLFQVKAEKGTNRITVFATNPDNAAVQNAETVRIKAISDCVLNARQYNNQWYQEYSVNAELEAVNASKKEAEDFAGEKFVEPTEDDINKLFGLI